MLAEGYGINKEMILTIDDIGKRLITQLNNSGWKVEIDTDYQADFKHFRAYNKNGPLKVFTRLDIVLFTLDNSPNNIEIRFIFLADPRLIDSNKRAFGKIVRKNNYEVLRNVCNYLLKGSEIEAKEEETLISPKSRNKDTFGEDKFFTPAYKVELVYWKRPEN